MDQLGFFDFSDREKALSKFGDPLERLKAIIDFEQFRNLLESKIGFSSDKIKGGRPAYDVILMFKILVLQSLYNLSDVSMVIEISPLLVIENVPPSVKKLLGFQPGN